MHTMIDKPMAPACERNRQPILDVIEARLAEARELLEVGSGTGQHAVFFAEAMPHLHWQPTDLVENLPGIRAWVEDAGLANVSMPLALDVTADWPSTRVDAVFTANSLHIMSEDAVRAFFRGAGQVLQEDGLLIVYGPFNYKGEYTSPSNADFDVWLKERDPQSGIRHFESIDTMAFEADLWLQSDRAMPANNRLLIWKKMG